jgi:hypothetical protein
MNMQEIEKMLFEDDLQYVAQKVSDSLNIFNETVVADNKLVTLYGNEEFIALLMTPYEDKKNWGRLRLRTKDMAATWENVPLGFSKINESRGLLADMKKAAHVSLKRNSVWYIDKQIKDIVGDRVVFTELTTNKGYLYKVAFTNGYTTYLSMTNDDKEYHKSHDAAQLYMIAKKNKEPLSAPMTADECIMMLVNIAMQTDRKVAEFISLAEQLGGKTLVSHSYRTQEESLDEAKAVFSNGYALKLRIKDDDITVDVLGRYNQKTYLLDARRFNNIDDLYKAVKEFSQLPKYVPTCSDET